MLTSTSTFFSGGGLVAKSCPTLVIPWTVACQAPLSMGFSRQEYCSGLPFPYPGDLPNPGIKPGEVIGPGIKSVFTNFRATHPVCLSKQCAKQATGNGMTVNDNMNDYTCEDF